MFTKNSIKIEHRLKAFKHKRVEIIWPGFKLKVQGVKYGDVPATTCCLKSGTSETSSASLAMAGGRCCPQSERSVLFYLGRESAVTRL